MHTPEATRPVHRGFTLVELLVMIAIIAMVACLLLPAYGRASRNTRPISCLNNLEQIGRGVMLYAEDHQNFFPQVWNPALNPSIPWWPNSPAQNSMGFQCGNDWLCTDRKSPETPAPMLASYIPNNHTWICPKRKRGSDYVVNGVVTGGNLDPSITGFISYGFNEIGVFEVVDSTGNMLSSKPFKVTSTSWPSGTVSITDCSGTNDPNGPGNPGAILDTVWAGMSGPSLPPGAQGNSANYRLQSSYARHNNRSNILYVDGHVAPSLPSALTWGQFWGVSQPGVSFGTVVGPNVRSDGFISSPALDSQVWSANPE